MIKLNFRNKIWANRQFILDREKDQKTFFFKLVHSEKKTLYFTENQVNSSSVKVTRIFK